jgi:hypothetical protein
MLSSSFDALKPLCALLAQSFAGAFSALAGFTWLFQMVVPLPARIAAIAALSSL